MKLVEKIITLAEKTARSLSRKEKIDAFDEVSIFSKEDKKYILDNLQDEDIVDERRKFIDSIDIKEGWNEISDKIKTPHRKLYYAAAASIALMVAVGTGYFHQQTSIKSFYSVKSEIKIGSDKAVLTLEDGNEIFLNKGGKYASKDVQSSGEEIVYQSSKSSNLLKEEEIKYHYLTIPRGGEYIVQLSDSTKIWLNSESQLKYPVQFIEGQKREVELVYGEAYFNVSSRKAIENMPFIVHTKGQYIQVLGTEFNINSFKDEIFTTLIEGSVVVNKGDVHVKLIPGEQSITEINTTKINIQKVKVFDVISWKEGMLSFKNKSLEEIFEVLGRWYDVDIHFENEKTKKMKFTVLLDKTKDIEGVLTNIEKTGEVFFTIEKNTIHIKNNE